MSGIVNGYVAREWRCRLGLAAWSVGLVSCAAPQIEGPRAVPLPDGPDRVVELKFQRYGPLLAKFRDGTVAPLSTRSDGAVLTRWRSAYRVRDFIGRGPYVCVITEEGQVGCTSNEQVRPLETVLVEPDARQISVAPGEEVCVVNGTGEVRCSRNTTRLERQDAAELMYRSLGPVKKLFDHTACALDQQDRVVCAGNPTPNVLVEGAVDAALVPNGPSASGCALLRDGRLKCWGGSSGESGTGERSSGWPPQIVKKLPPVTRVASGAGATCAIDASGAVWCFGVDFGPDFVNVARSMHHCQQEKVRVRIEPCPPSGPNGDNPCLRAGGSSQERFVEETRVIRQGKCVGPGEEFAPWPTRISIIDRARDVVVSPTGGIFFLREDGVLVTVDRANHARESAIPPRPLLH